MLASRDQENRIHGHQVAGAAKALQSQTGKHQPPKTPGAYAPKTPFKVPLNDENARRGLATGKTGLGAAGKGNENLRLGGKSQGLGDAFKTPLGARAPLGQKTTNAKARPFQTPAAAPQDDLAKSKQKSASARKKGPRVSHAKPQLVYSESDLDDVQDIGILHPRPKDLSDVPDDLAEIDLSFMPRNDIHTAAQVMYHRPGPDGVSLAQKKKMKEVEEMRVIEAQEEAMMKRSIELHAPPPCMHEPECDDECKDEPQRRRRIEEEYQRALAAIQASQKSTTGPPKDAKATAIHRKPQGSSLKSTVIPPKASMKPARPIAGPGGPSESLSRKAANTLSLKPSTAMRPANIMPQAKPTAQGPAPARSRLGSSQAPLAINNPSRYAAAKQVSNTTMGYAKGRAVSGTKRKSILPRSDMVAFQAPTVQELSMEADEDAIVRQEELRRTFIEDALDDFQLELPEA